VWVTVTVTLRFAEHTEPAVMEDARSQAEAALHRYLNPYVGGPQGDGWPLGRDLNRSELYGLLQQIHGIEYADDLSLTVAESEGAVGAPTAGQHVVIPFDGVVCSGQHQVNVAFARNDD
jgi:hypothetical protein